MRRRALAVMALALGSQGCLPAPEHRCAGAQDCAGGVCVDPPGACAFADQACGGGLRFGEGAGGLAGSCVAELDAGVDAPDARPAPDEDRDGVPDSSDNCPHVANPGQQDLTEDGGMAADGVGDACDPEPSKKSNRILLFDGFADGLSPAWGTTADVVTVDGRLRLGAMGQLITAQPQPRHVVVVVGGRGTGTMSSTTFSVGAALQANGNGVFATQTTAANTRFKLSFGVDTVAETGSDPIVGATSFTLALTTTANQWTGLIQVAGRQPTNLRRSVLQGLSDGWIGVGNGAAPIELDYVVVITLDAP